MLERFAKAVCRWFGHERDWPEMETCGRCGAHMPLEPIGGWVVTNAAGDLYRRWGDWGPDWTDSIKHALWFARREDAEAFSREDEDAWRVIPVWDGWNLVNTGEGGHAEH